MLHHKNRIKCVSMYAKRAKSKKVIQEFSKQTSIRTGDRQGLTETVKPFCARFSGSVNCLASWFVCPSLRRMWNMLYCTRIQWHADPEFYSYFVWSFIYFFLLLLLCLIWFIIICRHQGATRTNTTVQRCLNAAKSRTELFISHKFASLAGTGERQKMKQNTK